MRPIICLYVMLLNFSFFNVIPAAAQKDPNCFWQNSTGQTVDLSKLCGAAAPPSRAMGRSTECKAFLQLMKQTFVADRIIQKPATRAQKNRNAQIAKKLDRSLATVRAAKFNDSAVQNMQEMAIDFYRDTANYARAWNEIGAKPTQNQGFAITALGQSAALTYLYLDDLSEKTCGQKLAL